MKILFLGGDERQLAIINDLFLRYDVDVVGYDKIKLDDRINKIDLRDLDISLYDVIVFPVSGLQDGYLLKASYSENDLHICPTLLVNTKREALIFTGVRTKCFDELIEISNKWVVPLMEDNEVKKANSVPTVEGIIGDLVYNTPITINGANVLVIGYGNVGKLLVKQLKSLGANVMVGVLLENDYKILLDKQVNVFFTADEPVFSKAIEQSDIIVNTVPKMMLDQKYLDVVNKDTYILDISSYPYGVNFNYAKEKGLKHKLFLAIPSVVAPKTSGLILSKKINKMIGGK